MEQSNRTTQKHLLILALLLLTGCTTVIWDTDKYPCQSIGSDLTDEWHSSLTLSPVCDDGTRIDLRKFYNNWCEQKVMSLPEHDWRDIDKITCVDEKGIAKTFEIRIR